MLYRIKQFLWAVFKKKDQNDIIFVEKYLNEKERRLFYSLPEYEQVHSIRVARGVLNKSLEEEKYDIMLIKAALLHDIGKINGGLSVIKKSILVIIDKWFHNSLCKHCNIKAINTYYNHPRIALRYLYDENEYVKYLVSNHHNYNIKNDEKLLILQEADSEN